MLVCVAPVIFSYIAYYVAPPQHSTNYGDLISPQIELPPLSVQTVDGAAFDWNVLKDKFVFVMFARQSCPESCVKQLYHARQVRATTGESRQRIERLLVMLDGTQPTAEVKQLYEGTQMIHASSAQIASYFPVPVGDELSDHIFVIDHLGHVMMRFPKDADPNKTKKDIAKLIKLTAGWLKVKSSNAAGGKAQ
jgi:predicted TIM-barrel fold metal-dependent hydrolase